MEETCVQIDLLVHWAIERTHGSLGHAAARLGCSGKHHQNWRLVLLSCLSKDRCPLCLRTAEDRGNELAHGIGRSAGARCRASIRLLLGLARDCFGALDENARINSQSPADQAKYHDCADAEAAAPPRYAAQLTTPIFNSIALW